MIHVHVIYQFVCINEKTSNDNKRRLESSKKRQKMISGAMSHKKRQIMMSEAMSHKKR